jgi:hypothetical protein
LVADPWSPTTSSCVSSMVTSRSLATCGYGRRLVIELLEASRRPRARAQGRPRAQGARPPAPRRDRVRRLARPLGAVRAASPSKVTRAIDLLDVYGAPAIAFDRLHFLLDATGSLGDRGCLRPVVGCEPHPGSSKYRLLLQERLLYLPPKGAAGRRHLLRPQRPSSRSRRAGAVERGAAEFNVHEAVVDGSGFRPRPGDRPVRPFRGPYPVMLRNNPLVPRPAGGPG